MTAAATDQQHSIWEQFIRWASRAETIMQRMDDINDTVDAAREAGATVNSDQPLHPVMFCGTQGGSMTDHCGIVKHLQ